MTPFEVYQIYVALKAHFHNEKYDFFKYNKKTNVKYTSFENRRDRVFFYKLAKLKNPVDFMVSTMIEDDFWVGEMFDERTNQYHKKRKKRLESLGYVFKQELSNFAPITADMFIVRDGQQPEIIQKYIRKEISLETLIILSDIIGTLPYWDGKLKDDILWKQVKLKMTKYKPFFTYDKARFTKIFLEMSQKN